MADCLVRQYVPGPCLGTKRPRQRLVFRGRLSSQNQLQEDEDAMVDDVVDDDVPEEQFVDDKDNSLQGSDILTGASIPTFKRKQLLFILVTVKQGTTLVYSCSRKIVR